MKASQDAAASAEKTKHTIIFPLRFRNLRQGQLLLGAVREIRENDVLVSLPDGLRGILPITEVSTAFAKLVEESLEMEGEVISQYTPI